MPTPRGLFFKTATLAWASLLSLGACETAQDSGQAEGEPQPLFDLADSNRDNVIALNEWDAQSEYLFAALDTTGDARLSSQELEAGFGIFDRDNSGMIDVREAPVLVGQADADGDNLVSAEEFQAFDWSTFKGDLDNDGLVSPKEFRQPRRALFFESDLDRDDRLKRFEFDESARIILFRW